MVFSVCCSCHDRKKAKGEKAEKGEEVGEEEGRKRRN